MRSRIDPGTGFLDVVQLETGGACDRPGSMRPVCATFNALVPGHRTRAAPTVTRHRKAARQRRGTGVSSPFQAGLSGCRSSVRLRGAAAGSGLVAVGCSADLEVVGFEPFVVPAADSDEVVYVGWAVVAVPFLDVV